MNRFVAVMMLIVGSAVADMGQHQSSSSSNISPQYADPRDFVGSPEIVTSSGWDSAAYNRKFDLKLQYHCIYYR